MTLIFDIETDGLLADLTRIYCLVIYDTKTQKIMNFASAYTPYSGVSYYNKQGELIVYPPVLEGIRLLNSADELAGHNIVKFDIPAIQKLYPDFKPKGKIFDTLLVSKLAYPDIGEIDDIHIRKGRYPAKIRGKYSLKAWGYRLGELKGTYNEQENCWSKWSFDMQRYCEQDVVVTKKLYNLLKSKNISEEAIELEQEFARIIGKQEQRGVYFDFDKAVGLKADLYQQKYEIEKQLKQVFKDEVVEEIFIPKVNNIKKGYITGQPFTKKKIIEFNPASRQMIADRLIKKYNWKPKIKTATGKPKIDEKVLETLDYPEASLLRDYFLLIKTLGQLSDGQNAWLKMYNPDTGAIHGQVDTLGAVTGRCTHNKPNLAQVPAISKDKDGNILYGIKGGWGYECRSLFKSRKGYKLVGCDASGLELRCLAHYMNDEAYTHEILNGDIHTKNQHAAGLATRAEAKRFIYAFNYGGGDSLIGSIVGGTAKKGKEIKKKFLNSLPALDKLIKNVKHKAKTRGFLYGLDKRKLKVRAEYLALNVLLQSAGAVVMKKALCILYQSLLDSGWQQGIDFAFVLNIHDEYQAEVREEIVEEYKILAVDAIRKAGEYFNFRCPLDGEAKVGTNWAETH